MRCIICENLSFKIICKKCRTNLFEPSFFKREVEKDFFVFSFYNYEELKNLLNSKYYFYGDKIYNELAKLSFKKFATNFDYDNNIYAIPIDDHTRHEFSHTAILTKHLKSEYIKPTYNVLKATNKIKYAGKDLNFRKSNPRKFIYKGQKNIDVILIDDIVTTGLTVLEAKKKLEENGCNVLFALTLCDAKIQ